MSDHHDRCPVVVANRLQRLQNSLARVRIEIARWLVSEQNRRIVCQRAGDGDSLLLPAAQLIRTVVKASAQSQQIQKLTRAIERLVPRRLGKFDRQRDVSSAVKVGMRLKN